MIMSSVRSAGRNLAENPDPSFSLQRTGRPILILTCTDYSPCIVIIACYIKAFINNTLEKIALQKKDMDGAGTKDPVAEVLTATGRGE